MKICQSLSFSPGHPVLCIVVLYTPYSDVSTTTAKNLLLPSGVVLIAGFKQRLWTCLHYLIAAAFLLLLMGQLKIQTWAKIRFISRNLFINGFKTLILLTHLYY